ncbi:uncharacterized protein LOC134168330 [Pezoporus occidentalis]|uniref:uncharacterized protein LOC134168330 n=1 Tax=Pezoporus occidentalis TaxID=407982 RepID=UPI002F914616
MAFQKSPDASNATRKNPSLLEIGALCLDSEIIFGFTSHLLRRKAKTPPRVREPPAPTLAVAGKETRSRDWHRWGKPPPQPSPAAAPTRGAGSGSGSVLGGTGSSRVQPHGGAGRWCSGHRHGAVVPACGAREHPITPTERLGSRPAPGVAEPRGTAHLPAKGRTVPPALRRRASAAGADPARPLDPICNRSTPTGPAQRADACAAFPPRNAPQWDRYPQLGPFIPHSPGTWVLELEGETAVVSAL